MESPEVHVVVRVNYALTLQKVEELVVHVGESTPEIPPEPFNSLIVHAPPLDGTTSSKSSEDVHHETHRTVFSSSVRPDPGWHAIANHSLHKALQDCAAAVVGGGSDEDKQATVAIYPSMDDYPPPIKQ